MDAHCDVDAATEHLQAGNTEVIGAFDGGLGEKFTTPVSLFSSPRLFPSRVCLLKWALDRGLLSRPVATRLTARLDNSKKEIHFLHWWVLQKLVLKSWIANMECARFS